MKPLAEDAGGFFAAKNKGAGFSPDAFACKPSIKERLLSHPAVTGIRMILSRSVQITRSRLISVPQLPSEHLLELQV